MFNEKPKQPVPVAAIVAVVALVAVLGLCGVGGVVGWLLFGRTGTGNAPLVNVARAVGGVPTKEVEGEQWTEAELIEYLKRKGVVTKVPPVDNGARFSTNAYQLMTPKQNSLNMRRQSSAEEAASCAGMGLGEPGYAWGRFVIWGDSEAMGAIRSALPK